MPSSNYPPQLRPMVSVWVLAYNHERYIRQCLDSILMQQVDFDIEVVIGEDASTDGTRAIIAEFESRYPSVIRPVYHDQNVGAYRNAYEFCYPMLRGKYIACLEADDYWTDPQKLQTQVGALENDKDAVACFTGLQVSQGGQLSDHWTATQPKKQYYTVTDILEKFNIVTCTLVFRNIYPGKLPYDPLSFPTGDVSLSAFLLLKGYAIYLDRETAVYRLHPGGIYSPQSLEKKNLTFLNIFTQLSEEPLFVRHRLLLSRLLADRAYQALCFEIKKPQPERALIDRYAAIATSQASLDNLYYPLKTVLRKKLFQLTGRSFGRQLS